MVWPTAGLPGLAVGLLFMTSTFTYDFDNAPLISFVRLLISDTQEFQADGITRAYVFSDQEIDAFYVIQMSQFQSGMYYNPPAGQNLPSTPVSYIRVAALALDSLASNRAKLAGIIELLDVKLDMGKAATEFRTQAAAWRDMDDSAGAFAIIEQCNDDWSFRDRWWKTWQRGSGGI